jgi:hypothetical protein
MKKQYSDEQVLDEIKEDSVFSDSTQFKRSKKKSAFYKLSSSNGSELSDNDSPKTEQKVFPIDAIDTNFCLQETTK